MSKDKYKTEYNVSGNYGSIEKKTLYATHFRSFDMVTFYDENNEEMFSIEDTVDNNLLNAINRLYAPHEKGGGLTDSVEYANDKL